MNQFKLLCLGDSLTEGYDIDPNDCWVNILRTREDWDVVNAGISGDMTAGMLARLPLELDKKPYTHVFIMGGTNDVEFGLPPNLIISNLKAAMRQLRYRDIHYTVGIPMQFNDENSTLTRFQYVDDGPTFRKKINDYSEELKAFLIEDETDYIDFRDYFADGNDKIQSDLFLLDGVHPSEKGHKLIYDLILDHYLKL